MATEMTTLPLATYSVEIDLRPILFKMECEGELLHGERIDPDVAERDYRRFLTLHLRHPGRMLVPSALIDLVWHYHILDTRKYAEDCDRIFGYFLHHDPYFGIDGEESRRENLEAWEATLSLWEEEFGEPLIGPSHRCSSKDCR
jgi:hypothetical protein